MRGRLRPALLTVALLTAPLTTGLATAAAVPSTGVIAAHHHDGGDQDQDGNGGQDASGGGRDGGGGQGGFGGGQGGFGDQNGRRDQGDWWFVHHCAQLHEWWQPRCQRDGGDMWHRGGPNGGW
ncbi:hypothetical protein [Nocardia niigatensis]|uniref:hypothetical protein n=1 Tax=Nocardia niigatensis TaxID=209249 RepID=UPI0003037B5F|nr:hypothetical protein [Nocardia niigatensis]